MLLQMERPFVLFLIVFTLFSTFLALGMEENYGLRHRGDWQPSSPILRANADHRSSSKVSEQGQRRISQEFDGAENQLFKKIQKFFASGNSIKINGMIRAARELLAEMNRSGIDVATYTLEHRIEPGHSLLYHLLELSVHYEQSGTQGWVAETTLLPTAAALAFLFIAERVDSGLTLPFLGLLTCALAACLAPYWVNDKTRSTLDRKLSKINDLVREVYTVIQYNKSKIDEESEAYIRELCLREPLPRVIDEVFPEYCNKSHGEGAVLFL